MKGGKPDLVSKYIGPEKPVAHGKKLVDDLEHLRSRAVDPNRPLTYDEIVLMAGQGNFVATLCKTHRMEGRTKQDFATVDIFRLENGMVVEHWDNVEPVPEKDVNGGKF
ncbi:MAG TPA: hypothetical protein DDX92_03225 [Flavobacteriales bacterium]|nr:hypothetical protein [Flavobacteriales bacterium]